jgi:hypothetical protein
MSYCGRMTLKNPHKYLGVGKNPIYKSRLELQVFSKMDVSDQVVRWGYEILRIPYFLDFKAHKYLVDVYCEILKDNIKRRYAIEVKSSSDMKMPIRPTLINKKRIDNYHRAVQTYIVNRTKWAAASNFCSKVGVSFIILNESDIQSL